MSKEKQCECCHEWWYGSEIKNDLCPNCYDYFKQLKQQLAEKQNTIDEINKEFVQAVHDWKTLCAEKDKEIERLKNLFELNNEVVINQGKEMFDLRVQVLQQKQNQTQLAIQELEKVKDNVSFYAEDDNKEISFVVNIIIKKIDNQINELKEKKSYEC